MNRRSALFACWRALAAADIDPEQRRIGMAALGEAIEAEGAKPGRKRRKRFTSDTPQFTVAMAYVAGEIRHKDAVAKIMELSHCEQSLAEKHLREMKPRAEITLTGIKYLDSLSEQD